MSPNAYYVSMETKMNLLVAFFITSWRKKQTQKMKGKMHVKLQYKMVSDHMN
jgi:hypothetical protein